MREIKFRAWNKLDNKMASRVNLMVDMNGTMFWQFAFNPPEPVLRSEYELMQYTGLHDKNGKEIYEGDVVHFRTDGLSGYGNVYYDTKTAKFRIHDERGKNTRRGIREYEFYDDAVYRVDGNIYESPELLGEAVQS